MLAIIPFFSACQNRYRFDQKQGLHQHILIQGLTPIEHTTHLLRSPVASRRLPLPCQGSPAAGPPPSPHGARRPHLPLLPLLLQLGGPGASPDGAWRPQPA